jgi:hypothetical protein
MREIPCPNGCLDEATGQVSIILLGGLLQHKTECPEQEVGCKYEAYGCCEGVGLRRDMLLHEEDLSAHVPLFLAAIQDLKQAVAAQQGVISDQQRVIWKQRGDIESRSSESLPPPSSASSSSSPLSSTPDAVSTSSSAAYPFRKRSAAPSKSPAPSTSRDSSSVLIKSSPSQRKRKRKITRTVCAPTPPPIDYVSLYNEAICGSAAAWERLQELSENGRGDSSAAVYEMMMYHCGTLGSMIAKDQHRAEQMARVLLPWLQTEARRGTDDNVHKMFGLGMCYHCPIVLDRDNQQALKLFKRADEQGHLIATTYLGHFYFHGHGGVTADFKHSAALYKSAANGGFSEAQIDWGMSFEKMKKRKEAYTAYQMAAAQGNCQGQHNVGVCLYNNFGVTRDKKEGVAWLQLAADQGYAPSMEFFEDYDSSEDHDTG